MVETGRPSIPSAEGTARALADQWGAKLLAERTDLGGVPALRIRGTNPGPGTNPVEGIVALREGKIYMIMAGVAPGEDCAAAVEHVRKTWKWTE
jgi:hypothetical protein